MVAFVVSKVQLFLDCVWFIFLPCSFSVQRKPSLSFLPTPPIVSVSVPVPAATETKEDKKEPEQKSRLLDIESLVVLGYSVSMVCPPAFSCCCFVLIVYLHHRLQLLWRPRISKWNAPPNCFCLGSMNGSYGFWPQLQQPYHPSMRQHHRPRHHHRVPTRIMGESLR